MKSLTCCRTFLKCKSTWFALVVGVLVGLFSWWRLPFSPRCQLTGCDDVEAFFFSPDGNTIATVHASPGFRFHLWDFSTRNNLVEISLSPISDTMNDLGP